MSERLSGFTTFGIGGAARKIIIARDRKSLIDGAQCGLLLGRGSNVLVSDSGYDGTVVINRYEAVELRGAEVIASSGTGIARLCRITAAAGLSGLEFAAGIPASVGGAVKMNAGAFGRSISDVLAYAEVLRGGNIVRMSCAELGFGYRTSALTRDDAVISATFVLKPDDVRAIEARCDSYNAERRAKQPRGKSAGSIFKNPKGIAIGAVIDKLGLKGLRVGGAEISHKHANIIVNVGGATARDVCTLIGKVKAELGAIGIAAQEEIEYIGDFS